MVALAFPYFYLTLITYFSPHSDDATITRAWQARMAFPGRWRREWCPLLLSSLLCTTCAFILAPQPVRILKTRTITFRVLEAVVADAVKSAPVPVYGDTEGGTILMKKLALAQGANTLIQDGE